MIWDLNMAVSSSVLLCVVIIQSTYGTIFPPVENPPPIPREVANRFQDHPAFNRAEDLPELRDGKFPQSGTKTNEEGWYSPERQSKEPLESHRSFGDEAGEIGPVATPRPDIADEMYQPFGIYRLHPREYRENNNYEIFISPRNSESQYNPERWVRIPNGRPIEAANLEATDTLKSVVAPVPFDIPLETQLPPSPEVNIIQIRSPNDVGPRKVYTSSHTVVENVPVAKQVVSIPRLPSTNDRKFVQQRTISDIPHVAFPPTASSQISVKKSFAVPPPLPPPLKGLDIPPKVISSSVPVNSIPKSKVIVSNKNVIPDSSVVPGKNVVQQVRHVWIPTSINTGKFITIPISESIKNEQSTINKGFSLDSTPVTVSDTWVLKQEGPVPVFRPQKNSVPPIPSPIVQSGKVIFQEPTIVQIDSPTNPIITRIESPKDAPVAEKTVISNNARDIWPVRKELNTKVINNYSPIIPSDVPSTALKSNTPFIEKSVTEHLTSPQKSIIIETKSAFQPPFSASNLQIVNGKPCPLPLSTPPKTLFSPLNAGVMPIPRIVSSQKKLPFARIIRVNRYPTGSYYLLNRNIRPSYLIYPSRPVIQQSKTGLISLAQTKQLPAYIQRKIPVPPFQTKQISIPVQSKPFASPITAKQVTYPFVSRQVILSVASPKSNRISFPTAQAIRFAYPWNGYLNTNPVIGKGAYIPEFSPFKAVSSGSESDSSSSESSSSEESLEASKEKKRGKSKKEKPKKEGESKSDESSSSKESEKESESNSKSSEKESEEKSPEKESQESTENSET